MLEQFDALPEALGDVETLLADAGYFSECGRRISMLRVLAPSAVFSGL
jgi:hypothetical protein